MAAPGRLLTVLGDALWAQQQAGEKVVVQNQATPEV